MTGGQSLLPVDVGVGVGVGAAAHNGPDAAMCARRVLYA